MNISIRPVQPSDLIHLTRLDLKANATHPLISLSFAYPFQATKLFLAHLHYCFNKPKRYRFLVAVLAPPCSASLSPSLLPSPPSSDSESISSSFDVGIGSGEIVGFLVWREPVEVAEEDEDAEWDWETRLPKGTDVKLWRHFTESVGADPSNSLHSTVVLETFAIAPAYQRQGIGTLLFKAFVDEIDGREKGERICMRASGDGRKLYERFGWKVVREYWMDLKGWGRQERYVDWDMVREGR